MTINSEVRKVGPFIGNGTASVFPFTFKVFQASDLEVVRLNLQTNVETLLTLTSNYTVFLNPDQDSNPGGSVTLVGGALARGYTLTVTSDVPYVQPTDQTNQGGFYPEVINDSLDRATIQIQQLGVDVNRSIKIPVSASGIDVELPAPKPNDLIGWDSAGKKIINVDPASIGTVVAYSTAYADVFEGDGVTQDFVLSHDPAVLYNLDVSIQGATQEPTRDYTLAGTTISFTTAPPDNTRILVKYKQGLPVSSADSQDVRYLPPFTGAVGTNVEDKLAQTVSVKDFGAVGDGVTDDTAAIQAAIDAVTTNGGVVFFPVGVYRVSQIILKSYVTLKGVRMENGWARLLTYDKSVVIKSLNASGVSPVKIQSPSTNWGIQDLIIDANKANQTLLGIHCIEHERTSTTNSPGGLISGVKCVNPTGFGMYLVGVNPLDVSNCFFMSGVFMSRCFDTNFLGCSIDGTDSKHPPVWLVGCNFVQFADHLIFRGESASQRVAQTYTINTATDVITVADDSVFYTGMPITLETAGTYPELTSSTGGVYRGSNTYIVKKLGSNQLELYWLNTNQIYSANTKVLFNTVGVGTQTITSGANDIIQAAQCYQLKFSDSRIAGSPGGAASFILSQYVQYDNIDQYLLNYDENALQYGVLIQGSEFCNITNGFVGSHQEYSGGVRVHEAVKIVDDNSAPAGSAVVSSGCILGNNNYNVTQGLYVNDTSTATYEQRNKIVGLDSTFGGLSSAANRVISNTFRSEPTRYYYSAGATSAQSIADSTATDIGWTAVTNGNPRGITNGNTLTFPMTEGSLVKVEGSLGFTRVAGTYYILVYVTINGVAHRVYFEQEVTKTTPSLITVPFNVTTPVSSDAVVTIQVYQTSGGALSLRQNTDTTWLTVQKVADYQYV